MSEIKVHFTGSDGLVSSANIPTKRVEGLDELLGTLAIHINGVKDEFGAFKKHAEHDIEKTQNELSLLTKLVNYDIKQINVTMDVNKTAQDIINKSVTNILKDINRNLMITVIAFSVFALVTWGYIGYTLLHHG